MRFSVDSEISSTMQKLVLIISLKKIYDVKKFNQKQLVVIFGGSSLEIKPSILSFFIESSF